MKILSLILLLSALTFGQSNMLLLMGDDYNYLPETKAYIARVKADGGVIIDAESINTAITNAKDSSYYDNIKLWVSADFGIKKDANNKILRLYNIIGNKDFVQTDTSKSPTWIDDSLGGKPIVAFDGSDDFMSVDTFYLSGDNAISVYAPLQSVLDAANAILELSTNATTSLTGFLFSTNATKYYSVIYGNAGASVNSKTFNGAWAKINVIFDKSAATNEAGMYINGVNGTQSTNFNNSNNFGDLPLYLGGRGGTTAFTKVDLPEMLILNTARTAKLDVYFDNKYFSELVSNIFDDGKFDDGINLGGGIHTPFSNFKFTTTTEYFDLTANPILYGVYPTWSYLRIFVADTLYSYNKITSTAKTRITLPSGSKTVEITEDGTSKPSSTVLGTYITGIYPQPLSTNTILQDEVDERLIFVGNSITNGGNATYLQKGFPMLFRDSSNYVNVYGWGYGGIWDMAKDSATAQTTVNWIDSLADGTDSNKVIICLGTNDYGLNKMDSSDFADDYSFFLYLLNKQRSDIKIFAVTPLVRSSEGANTFGNTLDDYREAIGVAATGKAYVTVINGKTILTTGDLADGVHPTTAGHLKVYEALKLLIL